VPGSHRFHSVQPASRWGSVELGLRLGDTSGVGLFHELIDKVSSNSGGWVKPE